MLAALDHEHACTASGPDCGHVRGGGGCLCAPHRPSRRPAPGYAPAQCIRVLAECNPNPPPIAVYRDCMASCLTKNEDCSMCVDIHAECAFAS